MKKCYIAIISVICLFIASSVAVFASGNGFNSQGSISFAGTDEQVGTSDDIIFDANDLNTIYDEVNTGKILLKTAITDNNGSVSQTGDIPTFEELKNGVDTVKTNNKRTVYDLVETATGETVNSDEDIIPAINASKVTYISSELHKVKIATGVYGSGSINVAPYLEEAGLDPSSITLNNFQYMCTGVAEVSSVNGQAPVFSYSSNAFTYNTGGWTLSGGTGTAYVWGSIVGSLNTSDGWNWDNTLGDYTSIDHSISVTTSQKKITTTYDVYLVY